MGEGENMNELKQLSDQEQQEASFDAFLTRMEQDRRKHYRKVFFILRVIMVACIIFPFTPIIIYCLRWLFKP